MTIRFAKSRTGIRCRRTVARAVRRGDHHVMPGSGTRDQIVTHRSNGTRGRPGTRDSRVIRGHGATIDGRKPRGIVTRTGVTGSSSAIPGNLARLDRRVSPGSGTLDPTVTRRGNGTRGRPGTRDSRVIRGHGATIDGRRPRGIVTRTGVTGSSSAIPGNLARLDHRVSPGSGTLDPKAIARTRAGRTRARAEPRNAGGSRTRTDRSRHGPTGTPGHRAPSRRATSRRDRPNTQIETGNRSTRARTAGASHRGSRSPEAARTVAQVTGATRGNRNPRDTTLDLVPVPGGRLHRAASNAIAYAVAGRRSHLRHHVRVVRTANQVPASNRHRAPPRDRASRSPLRLGLPSVGA